MLLEERISSSTCGLSPLTDCKHRSHAISFPLMCPRMLREDQRRYRLDGALLFQQGGFQLAAIGTQNALKDTFFP